MIKAWLRVLNFFGKKYLREKGAVTVVLVNSRGRRRVARIETTALIRTRDGKITQAIHFKDVLKEIHRQKQKEENKK